MLYIGNPGSFVQHNHAANETLVSVTKLRATLKQQAKLATYRGCSQVMDFLPTLVSWIMQTSLSAERGALPKEPTDLRELVITDDLK